MDVCVCGGLLLVNVDLIIIGLIMVFVDGFFLVCIGDFIVKGGVIIIGFFNV